MALEGDIVASLTLNHSQFDKGLKDSAALAGKFGGTMGGLTGVLNRHKSTLTQVSFAADDFLGVLGTSGNVGAALRATSNNIGTLVTAINPLAGIATTLALALGATLIPKLFGWGKAAKDAAKANDELSESTKRLIGSADAQQKALEDRLRIEDMTDPESISREIEEINRRIKTAGDEYRSLFLERKAIEQIPGRGTQADLDAIRKRQQELEALSKELNQKRDQLNKQWTTALDQQNADEAAAFAERNEKLRKEMLKAEDDLKKHQHEMAQGLPGADSEFELRGHLAPPAIESPARAPMKSHEPQSPAAVQRGTAQAYSAIVKAMAGRERDKELKALNAIVKNTDPSKAKAKPVELTVVESF